ncbi:class I SAM-dependent DNA methyltransferase [Gryllotalpicola daejeonensis]|uniref:site-specific DNA-methyltransferase (adenine-specific) n=1 Tax=Gryllotalpicola daejeonensis TaxID=993087 RepID=A0ABP7ZD20_9MICO
MTLIPTQPQHLTQQQLERALWNAANALRGPVDPGDFKAYVFPVMFYKWICDTWIYEYNRSISEFDEDFVEDHTFQIPDGAHWADVINTPQNVGAKLADVLLRLVEANPEKLDGVFGDVNWANKERLPESALLELLDAFDRIKLDPSSISGDVLGSAYEYLLREFAEASGKKAGEFYTPRSVVHLLTKILDPKAGESVADPACGSAGILVEVSNAVRAGGGDPAQLRLYGQEINLTTSAIAKMNLYLHGAIDPHIYRGDTLRDPKLTVDGKLMRFDVTAANPPFSLQGWGADGWSADPWGRALGAVPPAKNGDYAWIQHMVSTMKDGTGRAGIIMPHGVLFRGGAEQKIRQELIERDLLEAVIGLPKNLFYSTSIPVCILVFRAEKPVERLGKVLFIDADRRFVPGKNQNTMSDDDIETVSIGYHTGLDVDGPDGVDVRLVDRTELAEHRYDLNIGLYIKRETAVEANVEEAIIRMREAADALDAARAALDEKLKAAGFDA